jgi:hypothetical protein
MYWRFIDACMHYLALTIWNNTLVSAANITACRSLGIMNKAESYTPLEYIFLFLFKRLGEYVTFSCHTTWNVFLTVTSNSVVNAFNTFIGNPSILMLFQWCHTHYNEYAIITRRFQHCIHKFIFKLVIYSDTIDCCLTSCIDYADIH